MQGVSINGTERLQPHIEREKRHGAFFLIWRLAPQSGRRQRSLYSTDVVRSMASSTRRIKSIPVHKTEMGNTTVISLTCTNVSLSFTSNLVRSVPHLHRSNHRELKPVLVFRLSAVTITFILLLFTMPHRRRLRVKCDGTRAETRFRLSAKRTSPFKSAGASVQL